MTYFSNGKLRFDRHYSRSLHRRGLRSHLLHNATSVKDLRKRRYDGCRNSDYEYQKNYAMEDSCRVGTTFSMVFDIPLLGFPGKSKCRGLKRS
jgi:hypothetical protein